MFTKILVPLDGSEMGELALPYAEELAVAVNSVVDLIYVCEPAENQYRHMHQVYIEELAEQTREHIRSYYQGDAGFTVKVNAEVLDGEPATEITKYAENNSVSLIVMVSHGRSGLMPWPMGSTSSRVTQRTDKPILLIRASASGTEPSKGELFSKILVPLDGSKEGEAALPYIKELTSKVKAEVTLFQVVEPGQHVHTVGGLDYVLFPEPEVEHLVADARKYLEEAGKELVDTQADVKCIVSTGRPAQEIIKYANEIGLCLVAISTHGRSGVRRWISGSVAYKVLQGGNTPVLLVRASGIEA